MGVLTAHCCNQIATVTVTTSGKFADGVRNKVCTTNLVGARQELLHTEILKISWSCHDSYLLRLVYINLLLYVRRCANPNECPHAYSYNALDFVIPIHW